jgi:DNA primase
LASAIDAVEHKIRMVTQGLDPVTDTHRAHLALEEILQTVARAPRLSALTQGGARLREQQVISRLARWFLVSEVQLRQRLAELRGRARRRDEAQPSVRTAGTIGSDAWDRALLELVLARPDWMERITVAIPPDALRSAACRSIYSLGMKLAQAGVEPAFERLMLECEDPEVRSLLFELDESSRAKAGSDRQLELDQILESYRRRKEDVQHHQTVAALRKEESEASQLQALDDLIAALRPRHRRSDPTDG